MTGSSGAESRWQHPTGRNPDTVAIVACGPTQAEWHRANIGYARQFDPQPEVWTVNKALRTVRADIVWIMDDLVGEGGKAETYRYDIDTCSTPIITSHLDAAVRAMYPRASLYAYPLDDVIWDAAYHICAAAGDVTLDRMVQKREAACYLHNSIPYMLAYALYIGVRRILLFGVDYTHPSNPADVREDDRANAEYWVGMAIARGVEVVVPGSTSLLNVCYRKPLYGYGARQPTLRAPTEQTIAECRARAARTSR